MFRASSRPSSGTTTTAVAASGLPSERGGNSAVSRGRTGMSLLTVRRPEGFMYSSQYFCMILKTTGVARKIFITVANTSFHGNLASGNRADTFGQTD